MVYLKKEYFDFMFWYFKSQPRGTVFKKRLEEFSKEEIEEIKFASKNYFEMFTEDFNQYQKGFVRGNGNSSSYVPKDTYKRGK
tara:strand:- start:14094 stop:14342 length:249 start_codon:yes stop_codon:yes gene_type:complete